MPARPPNAPEPRDLMMRFRFAAGEAEEARIAAKAEDRSLSDFVRLATRDRVRAVKKRHPELFREPKTP